LLDLGLSACVAPLSLQTLQVFVGVLQEANIEHVFYELPGTDHAWQTWRRDLKDFAPRLF